MSLIPSAEATYYEILEISPLASLRDIHAAYARARETYSPDSPALYSMFSPEEAKQWQKLIEEAFSVLSHAGRRKDYDLSLAQGQSTSPPAATTGLRSVANPERPSSPKANDGLPEGFARSRFGPYEVDPHFEKELAGIDECDGTVFKRIRQYKKVQLEQLSEHIRVSKSNISAIETNAFESLPKAVFVRGFVVQICRALQVDEKRLVDAYMKYYRKQTGA